MDSRYFKTGIYSLGDVSRLTGVSTGRIRRWPRGYRYRSGKKTYTSPPLWQGQWRPIERCLALGFLDLIEVRFVDAFLHAGISWATMHQARARAQDVFGVSHPFCTCRFVTNGREIFVQLHQQTGEVSLMDMVKQQHVFSQIMNPFLKELEFADGSGLARWWPLGDKRLVVLDPTRNFGRPIIETNGVPTEVLANAMKASRSLADVALWYEVSDEAVRDAVDFEQRLAA
jgi:uncharacterized protein (DUF433 family)